MSALRMFTNDAEPPLGERITLMDSTGYQIVWTGKRWYDPRDDDGSLQTQDCWPPRNGDGPWFEVLPGGSEVCTSNPDHVLSHLYQVSGGDLALCGCGWPQAAWETIDAVLAACRDNESLGPLYDASPGLAHIALSALEAADLIEHGTIVTRAWLTDKGRWVLWAIDHVGGIEDMDDKVGQAGFPHYPDACTAACWVIPVPTDTP